MIYDLVDDYVGPVVHVHRCEYDSGSPWLTYVTSPEPQLHGTACTWTRVATCADLRAANALVKLLDWETEVSAVSRAYAEPERERQREDEY
jgi:hypothetical protein